MPDGCYRPAFVLVASRPSPKTNSELRTSHSQTTDGASDVVRNFASIQSIVDKPDDLLEDMRGEFCRASRHR